MHTQSWKTLGSAFVLFALSLCMGCNNDTPAEGENGEEEAHAHDHGASEKLGPNEGHLLEFIDAADGTPAPCAAEWLHDDDTDTITVFLLDTAGENIMPMPVDQVVINVMYTGLDTTDFVLPAVKQEGEESTEHAEFQLTDPQLMTALKMESGVINSLELEIDGKTYMAQIVHHDHGHGHSHSHD